MEKTETEREESFARGVSYSRCCVYSYILTNLPFLPIMILLL